MEGQPEDSGVGEQIILEEEIDEHYEPSDDEIREYAKWLGMDVEAEEDLLWIARDGLKAPLPPQWKPCSTPQGEIYYFNFSTGESIWDHPCDGQYRALYQHHKNLRQQQGQLQRHQQQQHQQQQQHMMPSSSGDMGSMQDRSQAPAILQLPSYTRVEPWQRSQISPSGTLSTVPSIIASMPASPTAAMSGLISGLSRDISSKGATPTLSRSTSQNAGTGGAGDMDWRVAEKTADHEARRIYRQQLMEERSRWEAAAKSELMVQSQAVKQEQQQRLWSLRQQLDDQERQQAAAMQHEMEMRLREARAKMQEQQVMALDTLEAEHQASLIQARTRHSQTLEALHQQQASQVHAAAKDMQETAKRLAQPLSEAELDEVRSKALEAAQEEAGAEAAALKQQLLEEKQKKVGEEVELSLDHFRSSLRAEALSALSDSFPKELAASAAALMEKSKKLQELEQAIADKATVLQQLEDKEQQLRQSITSKGGPSLSADAAAATTAELTAIKAKLAAAQHELDGCERQLAEKKKQIGAAEAEAATKREELAAAEAKASEVRAAQAAAVAQMTVLSGEQQIRATELTYANQCLQQAKQELADSQVELKRLQEATNERRAALTSTVAELSKRRSELAGLESGLCDALRRQTDEEVRALEQRLARTKQALSASESSLSSQQAALAAVTRQLVTAQSSLASVEAGLSDKRRELELLVRKCDEAADKEFREGKSYLMEEEVRLLAAARASMEERVACQVEQETAACLAGARRRMAADVDAQVAREQPTLLAERQEQVERWLAGQDNSRAAAVRGQMACATSGGFSTAGERPSLVSLGLQLPAMTASVMDQSLPDGDVSNISPPREQSATLAAIAAAAEAVRFSLGAAQQALAVAARDATLGLGPSKSALDYNREGREQGLPDDAWPEQEVRTPTAGAAAAAGGGAQRPLVMYQRVPSPGPGPSEQQLCHYDDLLQQATHFIKEQRHLLQQRQATLLAAQEDWRQGLAAVERQHQQQQSQQQGDQRGSNKSSDVANGCRAGGSSEAGGSQDGADGGGGRGILSDAAGGGGDGSAHAGIAEVARQQALSGLRELKQQLQSQVHQLNADTRLLRQLRSQVKTLQQVLPKSTEYQASRPRGPGGCGSDFLPYVSSSRVQPPLGPRPASTAAAGGFGPHSSLHHGWGHRTSSIRRSSLGRSMAECWAPQGEGPLEKMATALGEALAATRGWGSSSRVSPRGGDTGSVRAGVQDTLGGPRACRGRVAAGGGKGTGDRLAGGGSVVIQGAASREPSEAWGTNTEYITKRKDEREAAQEVLAQHSQWLASFRAQIAQMAALTSSTAPAATTSNGSQPMCGHAAAPAGVGGGAGRGVSVEAAAGAPAHIMAHAKWVGPGTSKGPGSTITAAVGVPTGRHPSGLLPLQPDTPPAAAAANYGLIGSVSGVDSDVGMGQRFVGEGMPMRVPLSQHQELVISLVSI